MSIKLYDKQISEIVEEHERSHFLYLYHVSDSFVSHLDQFLHGDLIMAYILAACDLATQIPPCMARRLWKRTKQTFSIC
jgi:hypothetical protein